MVHPVNGAEMLRVCCSLAGPITESPGSLSTFLLVSCCLRGGLCGECGLVNPHCYEMVVSLPVL